MESLRKVADREAEAAEAEVGLTVEDGGQVEVEPGEQGIATQEEDEVPEYVPPEATKEEVATARKALAELRRQVRNIGGERTVEGLIALMDVHPDLTTPLEWQGENDEEYRPAQVVERVVALLTAGCPQIEITPKKVICLWRNKQTWTSRGVTVRSRAKSLGGLDRYLTDDCWAVLEVNFHLFKHMTPLQKVWTCYHALRELDGKGKLRPADFVGYFDELEIFGARVFRDTVRLANSVKRGLDTEHPFQLSLLEEMDDEEDAEA